MKYQLTAKTTILSFVLFSCGGMMVAPSAPQSVDQPGIFSENIKTVQIYPFSDRRGQKLDPPLSAINGSPLKLSFDELYEDARFLRSKIIHCNANWEPSGLSDLDFLDIYNEFEIVDYEYSVNTRTPYTHYEFEIPRVKLPGNYLLAVYDKDASRPLFRQRFMVVDPQINIVDQGSFFGSGSVNASTQQIRFDLSYKGSQVTDPRYRVSVTMIQNHQWQNSVSQLQPTFVREDLKMMEYQHFGGDSQFGAGNEFRYFDLRSVKYFGENVETVKVQTERIDAILMKDKSRSSLAYTQYDDLNGKFQIERTEIGNPDTDSDYLNVHFFFETLPFPGNIYVNGALTNWELQESNKMTYDRLNGGYSANLLLKQGWYNFNYIVKSQDQKINSIEGDFNQTENVYTVLVYYKSPKLNVDLLLGYKEFYANSRY